MNASNRRGVDHNDAPVFRIVFIGPPGAGKGTQCRRLSERLSIPHLSTGEMLRATKDGSEVGELVASYIDGGRLAPDDLVMKILTRRLEKADCSSGYLLDGFPRNVQQARLMDDYLSSQDEQLTHVISLCVPQEILIERLARRAETEDRDDDTDETIRVRLEIFESQTRPVLDYYRQSGILTDVDGTGTMDEVSQRLLACVV
ncbi:MULTISPECIES: adenylate kinase [Crateriforma]|uniref:Adenylate kinase n=1 Tax=Crateriforma conspicua TaxID=2527996 RepID=A0A5C5Y5P7_9PLAN|nr:MULTISPECIES: adenylate kinase [Crateriforma]QDV64646.1 Adenylate kinase [Crateriforma conspicua]TWT70043.1 adenylate kinase [Crateriforma conspicua]